MNPFIRIGLAALSSAFVAGFAAAQSTSRESLSTANTQGNFMSGNTFKGQAISSDGRFVAFASWANNLVPNDTNSHQDVFVRDRATWVTTRVSVDSAGTQGNGNSGDSGVAISNDGRYVAFTSSASNLVAGDTNAVMDIFVHDTSNGQTTLASVSSSGALGNGASYIPSFSGDGRYLGFCTDASNFVAGDVNGVVDVFVRDLQLGQTTLVSVDSSGGMANAFCTGGFCYGSFTPALSEDGRYVVFHSFSDNLVAGDTNGFCDVFVHDALTGQTVRVDLDSSGAQSNEGCYVAAISADGRYVSFNGLASNLVPNDTNGMADVFVRDLQNGTTTRVSVDSAGVEGTGHSYWSSMSADGRYVAFNSLADNFASNDTAVADVFLHDTQSHSTTRMSTSYVGTGGNNASDYSSLSADGLHVTFTSAASNLVTNDTNATFDVFVRDLDQPGEPFCFGDGSSGSCPCSNAGAAGRGCENSASTGGAQLASSGAPMVLYDTLVLTSSGELPIAPSIFLQGDAALAATSFGDGLRCVGGSLKRLYVKFATGGVASAPQAGDPSISARSAALGDTLGMGMTRHYQAYYRDPDLGFCPSPLGDSWNVSNALSVIWLP